MDGRREVAEFERLVAAALSSFVRTVAAEAPARVYHRVLARVEAPLLRHALDLAGGSELRAARLL